MLYIKSVRVFLRPFVFLFLLFSANFSYASLTCTETPVGIPVNLLWAGASPNDVSTLNGSTSAPGHLQGRLKQCIPDGSVPGEQGVFEWLPPQSGDSAFFVGEINGPNSVALNGPDFNFVSIRMGNANFSGSLSANNVVIQDSQDFSKMNFNGVSVFAQDLILIDSSDGEESPDIDLTLKFDGGGLATPKDISIGAFGRATTDMTMTGSILTADKLSIQPANDGGGRVNLTLSNVQSSVSKDVMIGAVAGGRTDITMNTLTQVQWAIDSGFTTIGHSGDVNFKIQDGADVNTHETFIGFQPESTVKMTIEEAKWTAGNLVIGGFGDVDVTANSGAELKSLNTTIGSFKNTPEGNNATVTLNDDAKWNIDGFLSVGSEGEGKLVLNDQSTVDVTGAAIVGVLQDSHGTLDVHSGDTFNAHATFEAGRSGLADVTIFDGGQVDVDGDMFIGTFQHGRGFVTVKDGGRLTVDGNLNIGNGTPGVTASNNGEGFLTIENGGIIELGAGGQLRLGRREGSEGSLTMTGPDSQLVSDFSFLQDILVGVDGEGNLEMYDGAKITGNNPAYLTVGVNEKGVGRFRVDDSSVKVSELIVGDKGEGDGEIVGGATVEVVGDMTIGKVNKGENKVFLLGPDTTLKVGGDLTIGDEGNGELILDAESKLEMLGEDAKITLGKKANSTGQLTLSGDGQHLAPNSDITIGDEGSGKLLLKEGAQLTLDTVTLGAKENSQGRIDIKGSGSLLNIESRLTLSINGSGALTVSEGAELRTATENSTVRTVLGGDDNSPTSLILVQDQGSIWQANANVVLGGRANGVLNVKNGGNVKAKDGIILGEEENGFGEMNIGGDSQENASAPAQVSYTNEFAVGKKGSGAIHVNKGALLTGNNVSENIILGNDENAKGTVTVSGEGSKWLVGSQKGLVVAGFGSGDIDVSDAGVVEMESNSELFVGGLLPTSRGTITVDGINGNGRASQFLTGKDVRIGINGEGRVDIINGGEFKAAANTDVTTIIGANPGGKGIVNVLGEDSIWETGELTVGGNGTAEVNVTDFAIVNSGSVEIKGNTGNETLVKVHDGEWNMFNLNVEGNSQLAIDGVSKFNVRGESTFQGNGTASPLVTVEGNFADYDASNADVVINNATVGVIAGGRMEAANMLVDGPGLFFLENSSSTNIGGNMIVNNGLARVTNDSVLNVGRNLQIGSLGTVDVSHSGVVTVGANALGSPNGAVSVNSGGSLTGSGTIRGNLFVGGETQPGFGNGGKVLPGNSPGKLNVEGNFYLSAGAILGLEVAGTQAGFYDELSVSGIAHFAPESRIEFTFLDGFLPKTGDNFAFVTAQGGIEGLSNENFHFKDIDSSFLYDLKVEDGRFTLAALSDAQVVTPEPATMLMMLPGMAGMFWHRRRKAGKQ